MVATRALEDAAERAGVLEERRHEHQQRGVHEERLEALLDGEAGDDVDGAGEHQHRERLARDAAQDRQPRPEARDQRDHRRRSRTARATIGVTHGMPDEVGGEEQRRQRDHVAGGGDDRRGDVVEVPVAPHAELRDDHA